MGNEARITCDGAPEHACWFGARDFGRLNGIVLRRQNIPTNVTEIAPTISLTAASLT